MEIWGDESGNVDFATTGSRHFVVCTMVSHDPALATDLLALRRSLTERGHELHDGFHASEDRQVVRDEVFALLAARDIRIDATYYTKSRAYTRLRDDLDYFYKLAWYMHMRYVLPVVCRGTESAFIGIASLGVRRKRQLYAEAMRDVAAQCLGRTRARCAYWSAPSHPAIQAADYCTWAIARLVEGGDPRSYELLKHRVATLHRFF
jgi:hypothetical protein